MSDLPTEAVDQFAGAGGTSEGFAQACRELARTPRLTALNHWPTALETHRMNHPWARHILQDIETLDPVEVMEGRHLNVMVSSPECIWYSNARGGKPVNDQLRQSAFGVVRWMRALQPDAVLVENVPEFRNWGPLLKNGKPDPAKKGWIFRQWLGMIRATEPGYSVEHAILNAADYGDATTRRRLFVIALKGPGRPIMWPEPTHFKLPQPGAARWRPARDVLDLSIRGRSLFDPKSRPTARATWIRIIAGCERYGPPEFEPFLDNLRKQLGIGGRLTGRRAKSEDGRFVLPPLGFFARGGMSNRARSLEEPLATFTQRGGGHLVQPFILSMASGGAPRPVDEPMPTAVGKGGGHLVEAFTVGVCGRNLAPKSLEEPYPTLTHRNTRWIIEPFIVPNFGERDGQEPRSHPIGEPLPAATSHGAGCLAEPFLVKYYGNGEGTSAISDPMPTVTTKDRFALVQPVIDGVTFDILFRMVRNEEMAGAMSFPREYKFAGNRGEITKQIGNAVAVRIAKALCMSLLKPGPGTLEGYGS